MSPWAHFSVPCVAGPVPGFVLGRRHRCLSPSPPSPVNLSPPLVIQRDRRHQPVQDIWRRLETRTRRPHFLVWRFWSSRSQEPRQVLAPLPASASPLTRVPLCPFIWVFHLVFTPRAGLSAISISIDRNTDRKVSGDQCLLYLSAPPLPPPSVITATLCWNMKENKRKHKHKTLARTKYVNSLEKTMKVYYMFWSIHERSMNRLSFVVRRGCFLTASPSLQSNVKLFPDVFILGGDGRRGDDFVMDEVL